MGSKRGKVLVVLISLLLPAVVLRIPAANAIGNLYISPVATPLQAPGSNFTISVRVAGMDPFDGWEIQVVSDPSVISATNISLTGNILAASNPGIAFPLRSCINDNQTGSYGCCLTTSCTPTDGNGIADSGYAYNPGASGSGLLFNVTFRVVSSKSYSPILIKNDQITNVGATVPHTTAIGSYGSLTADFSLSAVQSNVGVTLGGTNSTTITLTSFNHFSGTVNVTAPQPGNGIRLALNTTQTNVPDGGTGAVQLTIQAEANASETSHTISISANSSYLPPGSRYLHTLELTVFVHKPDFIVYATPGLLLTHQSSTNYAAITVASLYSFHGIVNLTLTGPQIAPHKLDNYNLTVPSGGSASTTFTVTTQASANAFEDDFNISATSGSLAHWVEVVVEPPPGNFALAANPSLVKVTAGETQIITVTVTSTDYFAGTVYTLGSGPSGLGISFDPVSIYLNFSQTVTTNMKVTVSLVTSPGNHTIYLTVYGEVFGKTPTSRQHSMNVTLTVLAPVSIQQTPTFLGLQETPFFAIIGGLAVVLAVLGIFQAAHGRRPKSRPILER